MTESISMGFQILAFPLAAEQKMNTKFIICVSHLELKWRIADDEPALKETPIPREVAALQKQDAEHLPCPRQHWHDGTPLASGREGTESQGTAETPRAMSGRGHRPGGRGTLSRRPPGPATRSR